jgi:hypothetical protein
MHKFSAGSASGACFDITVAQHNLVDPYEFVTQHWKLIGTADFFTVEVWTAKGLQRFVVFFFIAVSTRRVAIAISVAGNGLWMSQIARNLTDTADGLLAGRRYLIHDRDQIQCQSFSGRRTWFVANGAVGSDPSNDALHYLWSSTVAFDSSH